jgi:hypothetical protein
LDQAEADKMRISYEFGKLQGVLEEIDEDEVKIET